MKIYEDERSRAEEGLKNIALLGPSDSEPHYGDDRDFYYKSNGFDFKNANFVEVVQSALFTSQNMFGEVQFEAEQELYRRLMRVVEVPDWAKGKL